MVSGRLRTHRVEDTVVDNRDGHRKEYQIEDECHDQLCT